MGKYIKLAKKWTLPSIQHGKPTKYGWIVSHPQKFVLGRDTDIGAFSYVQAEEGVSIGDKSQIGSHCSIYSVSTIDGKRDRVVIGRNAKIGSHSVVMPGVTIGDNAVVGAMSFINKDIPAGALAYGCPVKIIKRKKS